MLHQIQNIILKIINLRKGMLIMAVLGILVSGFVIGGGVRAKAVGQLGWKITTNETSKSNRAYYCGDDRGSSNLDYIDLFRLDGSNLNSNDNKMLSCVYAYRGNVAKDTLIPGAFENCTSAKSSNNNVDLFCTKATRLSRDPVSQDPIPNFSTIKKGYVDSEGKPIKIDTNSPMTPSHFKIGSSECSTTNDIAEGVVKCKINGGDASQYNCYRYQNKDITCDNADFDTNAAGQKTWVLYEEKTDTSCQVEVTKATDTQATGFVPGKLLACSKGKSVNGDTITDDGKSKVTCIAIRNSKIGAGLNGDLFCGGSLNEKIDFSDIKGYQYIKNPYNRLFIFKSPDDKVQTLDEANLKKICKNDGVVENQTTNSGDAGSTESATGKLICTAITQAQFFKTITDEAKKGTEGVTSGDVGTGAASPKIVASNNGVKPDSNLAKDAIGGIFTLIYQIVAAIIMVLLFIIRYLQMMVLLLFISVMTVLLNLSPNTGFLTTLAVPLWSIFAQIASLGAVGILIFLGSATMIGIEGFEYEKTIAKGAQVAIYVFVSNFTYFGLAFAISLLDGFTKLIVFVFGGGSVFKLFEALIASVSSISKIKNQSGGWALIPDVGNGIQAIGGTIFGKGAGDITTNLVGEIIVVIGLGLIIWVFGRIFFMLLTRVAILLLLLITSPIWVLGILVKDSLPSGLQGQVTKAVDLVGGTIVFNFAFITTLVLVTIITQKINGGISDFQKTIADAFVPATNSGLAFIDGVSANAQTAGVLSNDAFLGFGAGGFGETISVCAVLGINLAIIYFAFDAIANLIDTNIQSVGKAVGTKLGTAMGEFGKAGSLKKAIGGGFAAAGSAITGGGEVTKGVMSGAAGGVGAFTAQPLLNMGLRYRANKSIDFHSEKKDGLQKELKDAEKAGDVGKMSKLKGLIKNQEALIANSKATVDSTQGKNKKNITQRLKDLSEGNIGIDRISARLEEARGEGNLLNYKTNRGNKFSAFDDYEGLERESTDKRDEIDKANKEKIDGFKTQYYDNGKDSSYLPDYMRNFSVSKTDPNYGKLAPEYSDKEYLPPSMKAKQIDYKQVKEQEQEMRTNQYAQREVKTATQAIKQFQDKALEREQEIKIKFSEITKLAYEEIQKGRTETRKYDQNISNLQSSTPNGDPTSVLFDNSTITAEIARLNAEKSALVSDIKAKTSSLRTERNKFNATNDIVSKNIQSRIQESENDIVEAKKSKGFRS
jgi:hypothetical protein